MYGLQKVTKLLNNYLGERKFPIHQTVFKTHRLLILMLSRLKTYTKDWQAFRADGICFGLEGELVGRCGEVYL